MVSPISGAVCRTGAHPLNTGGKPGRSGRPPSVIRERLRGSFDDRVHILEAIADGEPMVKTRVPLAAVLPHVECAECGGRAVPKEGRDAIEVNGTTSATPKDRKDAMDLLARYGLGTLKEVNVETVRGKVQETLEIIRAHCPGEQADRIVAALRPIWTR